MMTNVTFLKLPASVWSTWKSSIKVIHICFYYSDGGTHYDND